MSTILIIVFVSYWKCNTFRLLREAKILLQTTQNKFPDRLLSPPITSLSKFKYLPKGKYLGYPILLCPDIGGSKLYNKDKLIWPVPQHLSPFMSSSESWKNIFELDQNGKDKKNISIKADIVGKLDSINILYKYGKTISYSFHPLIFSLKRHNYKEDINLFGAPYEFRKISNFTLLLDFFTQLKEKIEFSLKKNKKPIILVGHTLGGIILNIFLTYHVSNKWKKSHIHKFIAIHVPFMGCNIADMALEGGTNEGIGIRSLAYKTNKWYHSIEKNTSGIHLLSTRSPNKFIQKLLIYRRQDPNVPIHIIQGISPLITENELKIPDSWIINPRIYTPLNASHKNIINNLFFLELFKNIIKNAI